MILISSKPHSETHNDDIKPRNGGGGGGGVGGDVFDTDTFTFENKFIIGFSMLKHAAGFFCLL